MGISPPETGDLLGFPRWEIYKVAGKRILVVDDDPSIREMVRDYLVDNDFQVETAASGEEMNQLLETTGADLILLDVKLPGEDGFGIARALRTKSPVPIIMLTAQREEVDRVVGLELGADDYLTKPFSPRELLARIRAVLRRHALADSAQKPGTDVRAYRFAGWELNTGTRKLTSPTKARVELTNSEYSLLVTFLRAPRKILSRDQLLEGVRVNADIFDRSIDVQILRLRRKIEPNPNEPSLIRTERSVGYFLDVDVTPIR
jgi:DNA-binding response OmpR family regulator